MITQLWYRTKHNKKNKQPICCIKSEEKRVITIYNLLLLTGSQSFSATTYEYRRSQEYIPWRSISTTQKIKRENTTPKQTKCLQYIVENIHKISFHQTRSRKKQDSFTTVHKIKQLIKTGEIYGSKSTYYSLVHAPQKEWFINST